MHNIKGLTIVYLLALPYIALASIPSQFKPTFYELGIGVSQTKFAQAQTLVLINQFSNRYVSSNSHLNTINFSAYIGRKLPTNNYFLQDMGLEALVIPNLADKGIVWQFADSDFDNLNYHYDIFHAHIGLQARFVKPVSGLIKPYASLMVGIADNYSHNYSETRRILAAVPLEPFAAHHKFSFTYGLAVGIKYKQWLLDYRYSDLGVSVLGQSPEQTTKEHLSHSHLYSHAVTVHYRIKA